MKKLFTFAVVALISTTAYSQAVPNGGFETVTGTKADKWTQVRGKVEAMSELAITTNGVSGVASPHSGEYGLALTNTDSVASGVSDWFTISTRPTTLRFNAVYFPRQNGEGFGAGVLMTKWNSTDMKRDTLYNLTLAIRAGVIYPWSNVTLPIYDTAWKSSETPDSVMLTFRAGATNVASTNTLLWIDNVVFSEFALSNNDVNINTLSKTSVYPSPASSNKEVKLTYTLHTNSKVEIQLMDIQGKVIQNVLNEEQTYGDKEINVSLSDLSPGIYFYNIKTDSSTKAVKFVVE